jgi:hypothetical protein
MNDAGHDERLLAMLRSSFTNLGATQDQAAVMAAQMLKRARQVAVERRIPESAAMAELLQKVIAGRRGEYTGSKPDQPSGASS